MSFANISVGISASACAMIIGFSGCPVCHILAVNRVITCYFMTIWVIWPASTSMHVPSMQISCNLYTLHKTDGVQILFETAALKNDDSNDV